jgi:hypothetical protein
VIVKDVVRWLSAYDQDEVIALVGWWTKGDVEDNNDVKFTDEQWDEVVQRQEDETLTHIDVFVEQVMGKN